MPRIAGPDLMSPSPSPALAALRDATRDLHAELDRRSPLGDDDLDDRAYLDHAGRILGWLEPLERALRDNRSGWPAALRADARLVKSAWLESDLLAGGMSRAQVEALPRCADLPRCDTGRGGLRGGLRDGRRDAGRRVSLQTTSSTPARSAATVVAGLRPGNRGALAGVSRTARPADRQPRSHRPCAGCGTGYIPFVSSMGSRRSLTAWRPRLDDR